MPWVHILFLIGGILFFIGFLCLTVLARRTPRMGKILMGLAIASMLSAAVIAASTDNLGTKKDYDCPLCGIAPVHR